MGGPAAGPDAGAAAAGNPAAVPGRLVWRCRRGMKELDLVLLRYLRTGWPQAGATDRAAFERLLELPDPLIAAYVLGREAAPDPELARLVAALRED